MIRKKEEAYAGLLGAPPSTVFELGAGENRAVLFVSGKKMYTTATVGKNARSGANVP